MGSLDRACISGFLCRLCSEMHRIVIHIYGEQGQKHGLVEKINGYLPITISPTDPLPKTICGGCLKRVQQHYELLQRVARLREHNIELKEVSMKSELCHHAFGHLNQTRFVCLLWKRVNKYCAVLEALQFVLASRLGQFDQVCLQS